MNTIDETLIEWNSKTRRWGSVAATNWFCKRIPSFYPEKLTRFTEDGEPFQHVVATNGSVRIDIAPYNDEPRDNQ